MIHLSSVVLHTIISLATQVNSDQPDDDKFEDEVLEVLHEVAFLMADNLKRSVFTVQSQSPTHQV
jgi:hypothetical protein